MSGTNALFPETQGPIVTPSILLNMASVALEPKLSNNADVLWAAALLFFALLCFAVLC